jgi:hypothetical protein
VGSPLHLAHREDAVPSLRQFDARLAVVQPRHELRHAVDVYPAGYEGRRESRRPGRGGLDPVFENQRIAVEAEPGLAGQAIVVRRRVGIAAECLDQAEFALRGDR